jgi:uncharacterized protein (DUF433 family)
MPRIHRVEQRLGPRVIEQIIGDYKSGLTSTQIVNDYGISKSSVLRVLHQANAIVVGKRNRST